MQARQPLSASQKNTKKFFEHFPDTGIIRIIPVMRSWRSDEDRHH
jgi:hypothetical protein